ncbi:MAG: hypothetical protein LBQ98_09140 [Nitrososphaerota archaeon]|nr:hypothetical protein [Nitrososphaerota archaeon]
MESYTLSVVFSDVVLTFAQSEHQTTNIQDLEKQIDMNQHFNLTRKGKCYIKCVAHYSPA